MSRVARGFDRLVDLVPPGVDFGDLSSSVAPDLVGDSALADLLADLSEEGTVAGRRNLPRIRPILVALAARASGADTVDREMQHAAELLHMALNLHDLALGRRGGRRRRVVHRVVRSVGWLGGNHLTLRALELVRATRPEALADVVDTLREFAEGHALSTDLQERPRTASRAEWLEHADSHNGALFAFCCRAGGAVSLAAPGTRMALGRYGRHLGRLWQGAEDVSALRHGDGAAHLLARASQARPLLPVVLAHEADASIGAAWVSLLQNPVMETADALNARLSLVSLVACREVLLGESLAARRALHELPASRQRNAMERLAVALVGAG